MSSPTPVRDLTTASSIDASTIIPVVPSSSTTTQKTTLQAVLTLFQSLFANPSFTKITSIPTNGALLDLTAQVAANLWVILSPSGTVPAFGIALPSNVSSTPAFDGQTIIVTCGAGGDITTLSFFGSAAVVGAPSALAIGGFFALRYDALANLWYCTSQSLGANNSFTNIVIAGSILDAAGAVLLGFTPVASADNFVNIRNGTAGVFIEALGADAAVPFSFLSKGTGQALLASPGGNTVLTAGAAVNLTATTAINLSSTTGVVSDQVVSAPTLKATASTTVAALPSAVTAGAGTRRFVTDQAAAPVFSAAPTGGGAIFAPVYSDGAIWRLG